MSIHIWTSGYMSGIQLAAYSWRSNKRFKIVCTSTCEFSNATKIWSHDHKPESWLICGRTSLQKGVIWTGIKGFQGFGGIRTIDECKRRVGHQFQIGSCLTSNMSRSMVHNLLVDLFIEISRYESLPSEGEVKDGSNRYLSLKRKDSGWLMWKTSWGSGERKSRKATGPKKDETSVQLRSIFASADPRSKTRAVILLICSIKIGKAGGRRGSEEI